VDRPDGRRFELAAVLGEPPGYTLVSPPDHAQNHEIAERHRHRNSGKRRVVHGHDDRVEKQHRDIEDRGRQLAGEKLGHLLIHGYSADDITGVPLAEKGDRQPQHMPDEAARHAEAELALKSRQVMLTQGQDDGAQACGQRHPDEQRRQPPPIPADQYIVDEQFGERRNNDTRQYQHQADRANERHSGNRTREQSPQYRQDA
jgi:hypothetical protein